ncbi:hypothetical protein H8959_000609 [Pygathrix nigripes]
MSKDRLALDSRCSAEMSVFVLDGCHLHKNTVSLLEHIADCTLPTAGDTAAPTGRANFLSPSAHRKTNGKRGPCPSAFSPLLMKKISQCRVMTASR